MSREFTGGIKGLAILMVFVIHILGQFGVPSVQFIAGTGVSLFLILSGYGIESSFRAEGLKWYWPKKILTVLVPYWIVMVACAVYLRFGANELFTAEEIKDGFLLKSSNWYVPYILGCYLIFWVSALVFGKEKKTKRLICVAVLFAVWFIAECIFSDRLTDSFLRIRQMLCFPTGMWLCDNFDRFGNSDPDKKSNFKSIIAGLMAAFAGLVITVISQKLTFLPMIIYGAVSLFSVYLIAIGMLIVLAGWPFIVENGFMKFFGMISYELFLVHWQLMDYVYWKWDGIGRFTICTIIGVTILVLFDRFVIGRLKAVMKNRPESAWKQ